jgi:hypothetical protein
VIGEVEGFVKDARVAADRDPQEYRNLFRRCCVTMPMASTSSSKRSALSGTVQVLSAKLESTLGSAERLITRSIREQIDRRSSVRSTR